jgi:hypothetical protein
MRAGNTYKIFVEVRCKLFVDAFCADRLSAFIYALINQQYSVKKTFVTNILGQWSHTILLYKTDGRTKTLEVT